MYLTEIVLEASEFLALLDRLDKALVSMRLERTADAEPSLEEVELQVLLDHLKQIRSETARYVIRREEYGFERDADLAPREPTAL